MRSASGRKNPAAAMIVKRWIAAAVLAGAAPLLGSCGGASESGFSGYVADHWPRWAGGMPDDVPPRPGAPGYQEFIAHGGADQNAAKSASAAEKPVTRAAPKPVFQETRQPGPQPPPEPPAAAEAAEPSADTPAENSSVVKGGLY
jgi:hypothetical protein